MPLDFSIAIRTYNGAQRLPLVLDQLLAQQNPDQLRWEVLVIDNNSQDDTPAVVADYASRWRDDSVVKYLTEPRQGCSYGRDRAMREAQSDLVGFLDDDNVPALDWLLQAARFGQAHPEAGAYGANILPKFEQAPPPELVPLQFLLAAEPRGEHTYPYPRGFVPTAPGSVVRQQAWACVPQRRYLRGRDERSWRLIAASAEDVEVMYYLQSGGWQLWHNAAMVVYHHLPTQRLAPEYLRKLALRSGLSAHACRIAKLQPWQRPWMPLLVPVMVAISGVRLGTYYFKHRRNLATDLVADCQIQLRLGNVISPFCTGRATAYDDWPG